MAIADVRIACTNASGDFPCSSRVTGVRLSVAVLIPVLPDWGEPVKIRWSKGSDVNSELGTHGRKDT